ncbi:MAG TPA: GlsB/YeaQ/YmgE family stress response membrane protein [Ktedonobacterales bacterium]
MTRIGDRYMVIAGVGSLVWAWIVWIVIGGLAGWVGSLIVRGTGLGLLWDIVVGIVGGFIGGIILGALGVNTGGGILWTFLTALVGAIILLFIVKLVAGGMGGRTRHV